MTADKVQAWNAARGGGQIAGRLRDALAPILAFDWSRRASDLFIFWAGGLAVLVFAAGWWVFASDWHAYRPDVGYFEWVSETIARGWVPYRDFDPAYPPFALPLFVLPWRLGAQPGMWESYALRFEHLMLVVGWLSVLAVMIGLAALGSSRRRTVLALGFVAISPLLVGPIVVTRFDLWPAALATLALGAVIVGRERLGAVFLGMAVMAKIYPLAIAPLLLVYVWRRRGRRIAIQAAAYGLGTGAVIVAPFLVIAGAGVFRPVLDLASRPLQVESSGAALLWVANAIRGAPFRAISSYGSDNLIGPLANQVATIQSVALVVVLLGLWGAFIRRPAPTSAELVTACAAAVCGFLVFGKVLSGQYLIWLIPLVALLAGARAAIAGVLLAVALVLMQQWFPGRYSEWVLGLDPDVSWLVLARDLTLTVLLVSLVVPGRWLAPMRTRLQAIIAAATQHNGRRQARVDAGGPAAQPGYRAVRQARTKE
jgi:hypothetical protein